jgi:DnaJ-class molecular chaperone
VALTYYDVLGVDRHADAFTLRRAYHLRSQLLHPDRHNGASPEVLEAAGRAMAELNHAWAVLRDPESRRLYDRSVAETNVAVTAGQAVRPLPERRVTTTLWWRDPAPAIHQFVALA